MKMGNVKKVPILKKGWSCSEPAAVFPWHSREKAKDLGRLWECGNVSRSVISGRDMMLTFENRLPLFEKQSESSLFRPQRELQKPSGKPLRVISLLWRVLGIEWGAALSECQVGGALGLHLSSHTTKLTCRSTQGSGHPSPSVSKRHNCDWIPAWPLFSCVPLDKSLHF